MTEKSDHQLPAINSHQRAEKLAADFMRVADQVPPAMIRCSKAMERFVDLFDEDSALELCDAIAGLEAAHSALINAKDEYDIKHQLSVAAIDMKYDALILKLQSIQEPLQLKLDDYHSKAGDAAENGCVPGSSGTQANVQHDAPPDATRLEVMVAKMRTKIASDPDGWTRAAIMAQVQEDYLKRWGETLPGRQAEAVFYLATNNEK